MTVFLWVFTTILKIIPGQRQQVLLAATMGILLIASSWYNLNRLFLEPATKEYEKMKEYIGTNYNPDISNVEFIRPPEDLVRRKYGIVSSWDEYGMSSSYFEWVPDALVRQLIFEKTGDRQAAERLTIKNWKDRKVFCNNSCILQHAKGKITG
jgi:hypothetical protein